jgi:hypothetical protein
MLFKLYRRIKMPIHIKKDKLGIYFIWGNHGKKYYFNENSERSKKIAYRKAAKQAQAAYSNGYSKK